MVAVYLDAAGDVRSRGSDRVIAVAGTTPREARVRAALWAAAADALSNSAPAGSDRRSEGMPAVAAPTPISAAPSYPKTQAGACPVVVIDGRQIASETATALATLATHPGKDPSCR